jgi:hypothetical protein
MKTKNSKSGKTKTTKFGQAEEGFPKIKSAKKGKEIKKKWNADDFEDDDDDDES